MQIDMNRFRDTFFAEAADHLATMEADLLRLNPGTGDEQLLNSIFRCAHSIKGGAGTFEMNDVTRFTHGLETLLDQLRNGLAPVTLERIELLFQANDMVALLLQCVKSDQPAPPEAEALLQQLNRSSGEATEAVPEPAHALPPAQPTITTYEYQIAVQPDRDVFRQGIDPLLLLRTLRDVGEISDLRITTKLPKLADFEPETCYLAWAFRLTTPKTRADLDGELAFFADDIRVEIQLTCTSQAAVPAPVEIVGTILTPNPAQLAHCENSGRFFGAFLLGRGLVRVDQVVEALDLQQKSKMLIGHLALAERKMTVPQVYSTLNWCIEHQAMFGEGAKQLGHLTDADVNHLLALQASRRVPLGQVLIEMGAITPDQFEAEFQFFAEVQKEVASSLTEWRPNPEVHAEEANAEPTVLENKEMLRDFVAEASEHLEAAEQHMLALEKDPTKRDALDAIYRAFHTIKGISSFFSLHDVTSLAHAAEDLLNEARDGKVHLSGEAFDLALASVDGLKRQIQAIRDCLASNISLLPRDTQSGALIASLKRVCGFESAPAKTLATARYIPVPTKQTAAGAPAPTPPSQPTKAHVPVVAPVAAHVPVADAAGARSAADWAEKETVKVDRDRLDKLINVIGELVIGESMVGQEFAEWHTATGRESLALPQLKKIVRDLQEMSLSLRMVPVGATFQKMNRIVRDVAKRLGKQIQFHTQGEETEIDKTVVDQIGDPLMHMVRNAADHGIESPEQRIAAGKPPQGHVTLRAFHQGGNIFIELEDDGIGLDRNAIMRKAVERGLISEGQDLSDAEVCDLIFKPGFSTAKEVTDVSGRGVGMDVVRRNVEALQGSVTVSSRAGVGSIVTIRLPLTLAILDGLMVSLADQTYILPLVSVLESFRPKPSEVKRLIGRGEVVIVRGEVLPMLRLQNLFNLRGNVSNPCEGLVVIVEEQRRKCAILVDELLGQSQVVIKNLETNFRKVEGVAGATILGDGQIALILDVHGLSRLASHQGYTIDPEALISA